MKTRYLKTWPLFCALLIILLNVDWIIIPFLKRAGVLGMPLLLIAWIMSTIELAFWYWFCGWLLNAAIHAKKVQDSIEFGKQITEELKGEGYIDRIKNFFIDKLNGALDGKNRITKILKTGGAFSLFLVGIIPEPGSRFVGVVFCRIANSKWGFGILALGNIAHICYVVGGWSLIFSLFNK